MILYLIRHGDPIYSPDQLTPLGHRQAEAVAKRLALYGVDEIFASSSVRAKQTAQPLAELENLPVTELDWCNEAHAWKELTHIDSDGAMRWLFASRDMRCFLNSREIFELRDRWYEHPAFEPRAKKGLERIRRNADEFLAREGFLHIQNEHAYRVAEKNEKRVALFAHEGFGIAFLSCILDIPYPEFSTHFCISHTGMTVIEFPTDEATVIPNILTLSGDSHLYREGLPTNYQNRLRF